MALRNFRLCAACWPVAENHNVRDDTPDDLSDNGPVPIYAAVLFELEQMKACVRRLETQALRLMQEAGIGDPEIADELGITPQAVGKRRRRTG